MSGRRPADSRHVGVAFETTCARPGRRAAPSTSASTVAEVRIKEVSTTWLHPRVRPRRVLLPNTPIPLSRAPPRRSIKIPRSQVSNVDAKIATEDGRARFETGREELATGSGGAAEGCEGSAGEGGELGLEGGVGGALEGGLDDGAVGEKEESRAWMRVKGEGQEVVERARKGRPDQSSKSTREKRKRKRTR